MGLHEIPPGAVGPHGLHASFSGPEREALREQFDAEQKARHRHRVVDYIDPRPTSTTDYPWLRDEGWIDRQPVRPFKRK